MIIQLMKKESALEIMNWKYESPYEMYTVGDSDDVFEELMDGSYYEVYTDELIGFFCYGKAAQVPPGGDLGAYDKDYVDMGLGLKPELCGLGNGNEFILGGIEYAYDELKCNSTANGIRLTVAEFNKRAIKVYEALGFKETVRFYKEERLFVVMELESK